MNAQKGKRSMLTIAKSIRILLVLTFTAALAAHAQTDAQKAFAAIKNMPGTWEGKGEDGQPLQVSFKVVSGGTAVMSEIQSDHAHDMISLFNMDGSNRLLLTHYCSMGNQPRMQASVSPDGKTFTFNYVDATNLASPDAGHIQKMVLTLVDENHHTENWTFVDHGREINRFFDLHRQL
jgi:hypothetical protein